MLDNFKKHSSLLAATALLGCLTMSQSQAADLDTIKSRNTIRIAVANEIPYGYTDMNGEAKGAGPDVAKHIVDELGIDNIKWVTTSFSSLIPGLKADRFDMVAAEMAILPDRCKQAEFSQPNSSYGEGLLVQKGNPKNIHAFSDFADRDDIKVAIMSGADQLEMLQKLGVPQDRIVQISSNADAISTVSTGRADAYAATGLTASNLAGKSDNVVVVKEFKDPVIDGKEVRSWGGFTFASGNDALRDAVNKELTQYKKTDEWRNTLAQYGFTETDIKASFDHSTQELCSADK
ncbi:ectoine/hydroxyectoine ABC transporter substrate-binding protein EhuB [Kushneria phosphatilytica]|uniref:Ectoine/hydroxyectoine ABC transporter substrate-binding protein EhuB n=1 Tax=Kushneria phosphatilytica TaxID=657387 RepID=A0A1S1NVL9_9GAMM|nr:ectoine/hydroxyectoine ABC transporter substrate-binding protein EhuB [Kushneria phosphatilytica]OHV07807.1 ectoine/hydroxyectoine ABC transporter substrate-binding protein EhuB [Kushneria phosphatilytica]QEL10314.1 ectoine/hydroxyectoine ABC transporter substrate-binding protein EhuB [Kushneria phosphatilytica]